MKAAVRLLAAAALVLGVSACSQDPNSLAGQARSGDQKGYISGDGSVEKIPAADRNAPVALAGTTLDGQRWSAADQRGKVVVLNVWASWCAPCSKEAPDLVKASAQLGASGKPVVFMGINTRDNADSGRATERRFGITYPSLDDPSSSMILALQGKAPGVPNTLVLDSQGRIAARVLGVVTATTLTGLVDDVLAET